VDPQNSVIAGAVVTVTNLDTRVTNQIRTNSSGYFLVPLLIPGNYQVAVEAPGFKRLVRSALTLAVGQHIDLDLTLEVGDISQSVTVSAEAPMLDTASLTAGQNLDRRSVESLPVFANMTVLLTRFVPGAWASTTVNYTAQGYVSQTSDQYSGLGKVGGNEWTVDGATNAGADRRLAVSPNSEMIQEMRVDTANFDASFGHGTGLGISLMTRTGANDPHGSLNWNYWNNRWNSAKLFERQAYYRNIANARASGNNALADQLASKPIKDAGYGKTISATLGGPVYIPRVLDGKDRLFFFFNYSRNAEYRVGAALTGVFTLPTVANRAGDFSQLLNVGTQYQIYDPLTVRPDPTRPGHYVRSPFTGNIIPASRMINRMYDTYVKFLPHPNSDPLDPKVEPLNNYRIAGDRDPIYNRIWGNRLDYNVTDKHRLFLRWSQHRFEEGLRDWTWETVPGLLSDDTLRTSLSGTLDWTYVKSAGTIVNTQVSANTFYFGYRRKMLASYKPSDVGLPAYMDQRCLEVGGCTLPAMTWSGYTSLGPGAPTGYRTKNLQWKTNVTRVLSRHTLQFGLDFRQSTRTDRTPGYTGGLYAFDNSYVRRHDDTSVAPAGNIGLSWAAFMLGIPTTMTSPNNDTYATANPYYAGYVQEAWRVTRALTLNLGLRFEFEQGMTERYDRMLVGWDSNLKLPISDAAAVAYAARPVAELPASGFVVRGGSLYANTQGQGRRAWKSQAMLLPRLAMSWQLNRRMVLRGGYGIYYDTLNTGNLTPNQLGFSASTVSVASNDFGMSWNMGNPAAGISLLADPFPVRAATGTRFDAPYGNTLGAMAVAGTSFNNPYPDREHARLQRWRASLQTALSSNLAVEVVYTGQYSGNAELQVRQDVLPEQYWNGTLVRNSALASDMNSNVTNPFYINNFASLKTTDPLIYRRLAEVSFFTSATIQKNRLLRPFPQMSILNYDNLPMRKVRIHSLDVSVQHRFSRGLSLNAAFAANHNKEWATILNEYEKAPTQWLTTDNALPYRFTAGGVYQFPFGKSRRFWQRGTLNAVAGGWQAAATFEWQPGPLLSWPNLFFYGDVEDIKTGEKTLDRWFNIDAGFERSTSKAPAAYQKRVFPTVIDGLRADKLQMLNANVQKEIRITERWRVQLRLDAHNALNRSHFSAPNTTPTSTQFGVVSSNSSTINRWIIVVGRLQF
jgi:hypothetical protein